MPPCTVALRRDIAPSPMRALASILLCTTALATLAGCPTRMGDGDAGTIDVIPTQTCDPRVPNLGSGTMAPSCASDSVLDVNQSAIREGDTFYLRVDTRNRRNELHPSCVDRDSSEAVLRYTAPSEASPGGVVRAIRVTSANCDTQFDTVISVRNDCGPNYQDYTCNNDGFTDDGLDSRKSTVYFVNIEPEQYVYIVVDGYDGSQGLADLAITEFHQLGVLGAPCIPVPDSMANDPGAATAGFRCPNPGLQCLPGAGADGTDLCLPALPLGAPCDPEEHRNVCLGEGNGSGILCAQNPMDRTQAVCAMPGTAPGALCRATSPRCDGRLTCSPSLGFNNTDICVPLRSLGATCDPTPDGFVNRCDTGLVCCGDAPDAGATFVCRMSGWSPCFIYVPPAGP